MCCGLGSNAGEGSWVRSSSAAIATSRHSSPDRDERRIDFGASARTLPNGRVATSSEQRMRFLEPLSLRLADAGSGSCL